MIAKLKQKYADEIKNEIESSFIENGFDVSIGITKQYFTNINRINYEFLIYKDDNMWIKKAKTKNNEDFFVSINPNYSHLQYIRNDCRIIAKVILFFENNVKESD